MNFLTFVVSAVIIGIMLIAVINYFIQIRQRKKKNKCSGCPMADRCGKKV